MNKFTVTFKIGHSIKTWERFADNLLAATVSAESALYQEYSGKAKLIGVEQSK